MNDEEKNDQREDQGIIDKLKQGHKKSNISKYIMKWIKGFIVSHALMIIAIIGFFIAFILVFNAITHILDVRGSTDIVDVASSTIIAENSEIAKAENDEGYYFKINDTIVEDFLVELNRAYEEGHYFDHIDLGSSNQDNKDENNINNINGDNQGNPDDVTNITDFVYDKDDAEIKEDDVIDWFGTEEYEEYLVKLIRAEIASSYPKLGDYEGTIETEDSQGNKKDSERKLCCTRRCRN